MGTIIAIIFFIVLGRNAYGQLFKQIAFDSMGVRLYELYTTKEGTTDITSSVGIWKLKGRQFDGPSVGNGVLYDSNGKPEHSNIRFRNYTAEDSIRSMAQGPDSLFWYVAHDNFFLFRPDGGVGGWGMPPFNFPKTSPVLKIWFDDDGNLFAGTRQDNFYEIKTLTKKDSSWRKINFGPDKDSNYVVTKGGKEAKQIIIQPGTGVYSFAQDAGTKNLIWIGTNHGLFTYNKQTEKVTPVELVNKNSITVTEIYTGENGNIWFSTLEKGMGVYNIAHKTSQFYPYKKAKIDAATTFPIKTFCYKSSNQFFVAVMDSLPAIFYTDSRRYLFFDDSVFHETANETTDIKVDKVGNLILIKGGRFYISNASKNDLLKTSVKTDSALLAPFFRGVQLRNGEDLTTLDYKPELLRKIILEYDQNSIIVYYDVNDYSDQKDIQFAWKMDGYTNGWVEMYTINHDSAQVAFIQNLKPGKYLLQLKVRIGKEAWRKQMATMTIIVSPPFWQTWWFWLSVIVAVALLVFIIVKWRVNAVRKQERLKAKHEKEILELEAKALRAQMNPHFIFNCMNSIKSLIQQKNEDKAVNYLTTFSKLLRTVFQNSDKREISLFDEIEMCRLYTQLESMRFENKFSYAFHVDEKIDLKSMKVPALIIQPFIENAIWHGLMPKEEGGCLRVIVEKINGIVCCIVDDDGIGREMSRQNKFKGDISSHQSRGVRLTQSRLDLHNILNEKKASVETIDKASKDGLHTGTRVIIKFMEEQ